MSDGTVTRRLSKVARELNVGISTIVDFLSDKGIKIESRPTTKIDEAAYMQLVEEFQSDKAAKNESQQLNQTRMVRETISLENTDRKDARHGKEQEEVVIKNMGTSGLDDIMKPRIEEKQVTVVGKIDLDAMDSSTRPKKKEAAPVVEAKVEAPVEEVVPAPVEEKVEAAPVEAPVAKVVEKKAVEEPAKKEPEAVKAAEPEAKAEPEVKAEPEKKVEPEKKPEDTVVKARAQKLNGPTVVGKIVLPEKKKPVASSSESTEVEKPKKKKRKRIAPTQPSRVSSNASSGPSRPTKKVGGRAVKQELTPEAIQSQVRETLAALKNKGKSNRSKYKKEKRDQVSIQMQEELEQQEAAKKKLKATEFVTVNELATMMSVQVTDVISACMSLGMLVSINQRLDAETLTVVADAFDFEVDFVSSDIEEAIVMEEDDPDTLVARPPIVTVMGHVDHGKTSLLDYLRETKVIDGEAGGITQHIGAYSVTLENGKNITFLDTPGHEAFTAMRARGAQITDVVIVVIAADDNVMPQTKEAISHAQAAGVPMVFAINKIDRPNANPEKIKEELAAMDILVEEWGGKYQSMDISAKVGTNVDELLEKVLLEAELLELSANPDKGALGTIIESSLDKGRGYVTTLLIEAGTLHVGDVVLAGSHFGKVKAMHNERGQNIEAAGPSTPVSLLGFNGAPTAGDRFNVFEDEREAKEIATKRMQLQREQGVRTQKRRTLEDIGQILKIEGFQELNIIVKGDVDGSVEALSDSLLKLSTESIKINVIHKTVGEITESDVLLATASDAIIIGFQVRPSGNARKHAEKEGIQIRLYSIIYTAIEDVKAAMEGMLAPKIEEKIVCSLEIRETFKISKVGTIAGCYVNDGTITRQTRVRIIRDGVVVYTGDLGSLKRFKDDVKEVKAGYECGLNIQNYNDIKVDDIIEGFEQVEIKQTLS